MITTSNTDKILSLLTSFLNVQSQRTQIGAQNIANVDTPGYKAKGLSFAEFLDRSSDEAIGSTKVRFLPLPGSGPLEVAEQPGNPIGLDGNTVDMAKDMSEIAQAGMQHLFGIQLLQSRLRTLRAAIREGK